MPRQSGKRDVSTSGWNCSKCPARHEPGSECPPASTWIHRGTSSGPAGVIWLKRPMPDGQWPPNPLLPRDDSFSWWVRSHCGHDGGAKQWAFYQESDADLYEQVFRANPCRYTRCVERIMIENDGRRR